MMPDSPPVTVNRDSVIDLAIAARADGKKRIYEFLVAVAGMMESDGSDPGMVYFEDYFIPLLSLEGPYGRGLKLVQKRLNP
jgi:hypothetical protein